MESAVSEQPGTSHATIDHCLCGAALPTRTPVDLVSFADEDAPSVYCSTACARQDALDSLMAKDPRHSPSSSRVSKPTSSLPSSMTASTTSTMSDSTSASSFIYFSESSPSSASSLAMPDTPSHLYRSSDEFFQSRHAELVDVEEDGFLFQIVHSPTSPSNAASQPHMYADVAVDPNFKSHYQRVVASQDASLFTIPPLPSVGSPSVNASVAPSVPAVPVAPGAAQAPHSPPGLKRVRAHSNLLKTRAPRSLTPSTASSFSDEEEEDRSRTPQSWDQVRPHAGALESPVGPHATASEEAQADLPATQSPPVRTMSEVWREIQQSESPSPFQQSAATLQDLSPTDAPSEIEPTPPISDDYTNGESMARRSMDEIPSPNPIHAVLPTPHPSSILLPPSQVVPKEVSAAAVLEAMASGAPAPLPHYSPAEVLAAMGLPPPSLAPRPALTKKRSLFGRALTVDTTLASASAGVASTSAASSSSRGGILSKLIPTTRRSRANSNASGHSTTENIISPQQIAALVSLLPSPPKEYTPPRSRVCSGGPMLPVLEEDMSMTASLCSSTEATVHLSPSSPTADSVSVSGSSLVTVMGHATAVDRELPPIPAPSSTPEPVVESLSAAAQFVTRPTAALKPRSSAPNSTYFQPVPQPWCTEPRSAPAMTATASFRSVPSSPLSAYRSRLLEAGETMDESDEEDERDPFRLEKFMPTTPASLRARSASSPVANDNHDDDDDDAGNESDEDELRVWEFVRSRTHGLPVHGLFTRPDEE